MDEQAQHRASRRRLLGAAAPARALASLTLDGSLELQRKLEVVLKLIIVRITRVKLIMRCGFISFGFLEVQ